MYINLVLIENVPDTALGIILPTPLVKAPLTVRHIELRTYLIA
jgi:hypothetical protein